MKNFSFFSKKLPILFAAAIVSLTIGTGFAAWNSAKGPGNPILSADWNDLVTAVNSKISSYTETDPKVGVLTNAYVPQWNAAGKKLIDSSLYESVNTKLVVKGADATSSNFGLNVTDSAGASKLLVRNDGNVGIGTASPGAPLDIATAWMRVTGQNTSQYTGVALQNNYTAGVGTSYVDSRNSSGIPDSSIFFNHGTDGSSNITLHTQPAGSLLVDRRTERVKIDMNGNVGIGTTSPDSKLNIVSASSAPTTAAGGISIGGTSGVSDAQIRMGYLAGNYSWIQAYGNLPLYINQLGNNTILNATAGNVGIGTTSPSAQLHISANVASLMLTSTAANSGPGWKIVTNNGSSMFLIQDTGVGYRMAIDQSGNVGIGTTSPSQKLEVMGTVLADAHTTHSDIRYKKDITTLTGSLNKISNIRGVRFLWKDVEKSQEPQLGVIAQEVEKEFPEVVTTAADGYKSVAYDKLVAPLIEAVKELFTKYLDQQKEIDALRLQNQAFEKRLEVLEMGQK